MYPKVSKSQGMHELHENLESLTHRLQAFGVFKSVDTNLVVRTASSSNYKTDVKVSQRSQYPSMVFYDITLWYLEQVRVKEASTTRWYSTI
jgi:hypothetical protein